jgi:hypothetical protein
MSQLTTPTDRNLNWRPLERAIPGVDLSLFMFMGNLEGLHLYKHRDNRRYLNLDAATGDFYVFGGDGVYRRIPRADALRLVGLEELAQATPRCLFCHGTKVLIEQRAIPMYQGRLTPVVVGRCTSCDEHGNMRQPPVSAESVAYENEARHA